MPHPPDEEELLEAHDSRQAGALSYVSMERAQDALSALASIAPILIYRADGNGNCCYVNEKWQEFTGRPLSAALGTGWTDALHPDDRGPSQARWEQAVKTRSPLTHSFRFVHLDGTVRWMEARSVIEEGPSGDSLYFTGFCMDVTDSRVQRELLAQARDRYELSIRATQDGIWDWDLETNELFWTPRLCEILGRHPEPTVTTRQDFLDRLHAEDRPRVKAALRQHLDTGAPYDTVYRLRREDGNYIWVRARGQVARDELGKPVRMAGAMSDITAQMRFEDRLSQQEQLLEAVFRDVSDGMALIGPDGRLLMTNPSFSRQMALKDDPVGLAAESLFVYAGDYHALMSMIGTNPAEGDPVSSKIIRYRRANGSLFKGETNASPVRGRDGAAIGVHTVIRDVTDREARRKALKQSEARFRDFAEAAADWFWEQDADCRYTFVSANRTAKTGLSNDALIGLTREEFYLAHGGTLTEAWHKHREILANRKNFSDFVYGITDPNGEVAYTRVSGKARFDEDGRFIGYRGVAANITEQVLRDKAMKKAKEEAEAANAAKSQFLSAVSHELRTPITSIRGAIGLIGSGRMGPIQEDMAELLTMAEENCERLGNLVDDILDLERVQSASLLLPMEVVDLPTLVDEAATRNAPYADRFGVRLAVDRPEGISATINGDPRRLHQVLANLISNAAKFSPWGETVTVSLRLPSPGMARISVTDAGTGIDPAFHNKIFLPFTQADASDTRRAGGTGLGLAITRHLVELHGGKISFSSVPGEGSCFWIDLPTLAPPSAGKGDGETHEHPA